MKENPYKSEYMQDLNVNKFDLEEEWNKNGVLGMKWAERTAQAEYELKMAEQKYKITKAEVELEVRSDPEQFGWDNPNKAPAEGWITATVRCSPSYLVASENLATAMRNAHILKAAEANMQFQRRAACEGLTKLWIFLYSTERRVPKALLDEARMQELDREMEKYDG